MKTKPLWTQVPNCGPNLTLIDRDYSPAAGASVWHNCPQLALLDPYVGWTFFEDFLDMPCDDTTHNPTAWSYSGIHPSQITFPISLLSGVIQLDSANTDLDETYIQAGHSVTVAPFVITDASLNPVFFEARVRMLEIADLGAFIGLAEEGSAAAGFLTDATGVLVNKDLIGFNILNASPTAWNFTYKALGQVVYTQANVVANDGATWVRLGFYFDGLHTVRTYINGVLNATTHLTSAATFPTGEEMSPIIAIKTGEGVLKRIQVDYIKVVQIR